jgi:branched-chain amino acid transport system permease protein
MSNFITYVFSGLALGCSFALLGCGFVAIHRVTGVVNFAQGAFGVVAGLAASSFLGQGMPHGVAEVLAVLIAGAAGFVVGVIAIGKPGTPVMASLLVTLGLAIGAYAAEILIFGDLPRSFTMVTGSVVLGGAQLQSQLFVVIGATLVVFAALIAFFGHSDVGKALTACFSNPYAARLVGINVTRMGLLAFTLGGVLGGIAGVLLTPLQAVSFSSDISFAVYGFAAAIFGGLVRITATLAGGLILGLAQTLIGGYLNTQYQIAAALVVMLGIMVWQAGRRSAITEEAA